MSGQESGSVQIENDYRVSIRRHKNGLVSLHLIRPDEERVLYFRKAKAAAIGSLLLDAAIAGSDVTDGPLLPQNNPDARQPDPEPETPPAEDVEEEIIAAPPAPDPEPEPPVEPVVEAEAEPDPEPEPEEPVEEPAPPVKAEPAPIVTRPAPRPAPKRPAPKPAAPVVQKAPAPTRRSQDYQVPPPVEHNGVRVDFGINKVTFRNKSVNLPGRMVEVVTILARAMPNVMTHEDIILRAWGRKAPPSSMTMLTQGVSELRHRLAEVGLKITGVPKFGYAMTAIEPADA